MSENLLTGEYRDWLKEVKQRVRQAQLKAAVQVNTALLTFYWELGADIAERQQTAQWGSGFLKRLSADLMAEFPDMKGFSEPNIRFIRRWYLFYSDGLVNSVTSCDQIVQRPAAQLEELKKIELLSPQLNWPQLVAQLVQIPWGHNRDE